MTGVVLIIAILILLIPMIMFITSYKLKVKKIEAERWAGNTGIDQLKRQVGMLMSENELLKERLKSIELTVAKKETFYKDESIEDSSISLEELAKLKELDKNS